MAARHFDVFNGDADGLCALQQLRLAHPREAVLVTGTKRDIALLQRVPATAGDSVTALDISLDRNRVALLQLLQRHVDVEYFDHHYAGPVPAHPSLRAHLDGSPETCTSALVDRFLQGAHRAWAVVGAFGDGLRATASELANGLGLTHAQQEALRALGEAINYNAYGEREAELLVPPARLAMLMRPYRDPLAFAAESDVAPALVQRQQEDLAHAEALTPFHVGAVADVYLLPDAAWSRRVQGSFAHALCQRSPLRAHAVLCPRRDGALSVSVRAPRARPNGAETLCRTFAGGGGRAAAAGIDALPRSELPRFVQSLEEAFANAARPEGN